VNAEVTSTIFDPFFTTQPVGKEIELGLSIGYKIMVEQHEGTLKVKPALGTRTEFEIVLRISRMGLRVGDRLSNCGK
jgi:two-component system, NtrC family, sensor kinase